MQTNPPTLTRGYTIALISSVILSTTGILIRYLTQTYQLPTLVLALWRDVFASLTLLPVLGGLRRGWLRVRRADLAYLAGYGLALAIFNALLTLSVALNGAAISTVLVYTSAGFTVGLGWWLLKERLDWAKLAALALCLAGCGLVSGAADRAAWRVNLAGIVSGVLSGLAYAVYSLMGRSAAQRGLNPWTTLFYTFSFAALCLLGFNLLPVKLMPGAAARPADLFWLGNSLPGWGILFLLGAGPTVVGFGLYLVSLSYLPSSVVNLIVMLETVFTAGIAYVWLGERLASEQVAGSGLIVAGVACLRLYEGWVARQAIVVAPTA